MKEKKSNLAQKEKDRQDLKYKIEDLLQKSSSLEHTSEEEDLRDDSFMKSLP